MLNSQLEVCQEGGVKKGGTLLTLKVPDRRHGWMGHSWCHEWCSFTLRNISWKFQVNIFICCEVISDLGVNGQPPYCRRETRERERKLKLTLTLPIVAGRQGWGKGSAIYIILQLNEPSWWNPNMIVKLTRDYCYAPHMARLTKCKELKFLLKMYS